jgi:uncharacterized membrane protein YuzA (DUF378 family)
VANVSLLNTKKWEISLFKIFKKIFWNILPLLITAFLAALILFYVKEISKPYRPIFAIALVGIALPFFGELTNWLHILLLKKQITKGNIECAAQLETAQSAVGKWASNWFYLLWTSGVFSFLVVFVLPSFLQTEIQNFPQPNDLSRGSKTYSKIILMNNLCNILSLIAALLMCTMGLIILIRTLFRKLTKLARPLLITIGIFVVCCFISLFSLKYALENRIRSKVLPFLNSTSVNNQVLINAKPVLNSSQIIATLSNTKPYEGHHSHPEDYIEVVIQSNGQIMTLYLARDSKRSQEYWVFFPGLSWTIEIGRVTTAIFDEF